MVRVLCKQCGEDMICTGSEDAGYSNIYNEYQCPECGISVGVEIDEDEDEREGATLKGEDKW